MNYTEFAEKIKGIPSSYEAYKARGLDDVFIRKQIQEYQIMRKKDAVIMDNDDEIIKLINVFDLTGLSIGMVNFLYQPLVAQEEVVFFGKFETDDLVLYNPNGEIRCYEEQSEHLMYKCAKNGSMFLDALFEAGCFLEKCGLDDDLYNNEQIAQEMAEYCSELAGGKQYKDFYSVMFS
ncbi:hypothetical protein [Mucilaginibacter gotjawali]|uniref:Uncharacterized protein n=2 Tax=Mucilaginibacter gotjawali TaxID=1550579 RepID=A0A839SJU5_9SPHI|nr:hypothetical protein [Mucilaginibacter gotjawali]MBB3058136.1 hypothetical protein [Mucilaginibacter gotjawali]BAU54909.1 hypothetical protein MgSA37_03088 [Mucilaginibacter gotjawali]